MNRPALLLLIAAVLVLTAYSVRSYLLVHSSEEDLEHLRQQVSQFQEKVAEREGELSYYQSSEFVYKEALEQLGLTRPGEVIPILPDLKDKKIEIEKKTSASSSSIAAVEPLPYWKRWRVLFFEN